MAAGASREVRVSADVVAIAASVAPTARRTVTEQINDWARLGMHVERSASATSRQVAAVVTGDAQFSTLTAEERSVAHALIDADISQRIAEQRFGPVVGTAGDG